MAIKIQSFVSANGFEENTYIITDESTGKSAVIDPGFISDAIVNRLKAEGGLDYIILTHAHGDHIFALSEYRQTFPEALLVAGFDEKDILNESRKNLSSGLSGKPLSDEADIYVVDGESIALGESEIKFITTPGHTKGGICLLTGDELFSGDTLFMRSVGRSDLYSGNFDELCSSIKDKLFKLPDYVVVYPGHGPATSIGQEKRENPFV